MSKMPPQRVLAIQQCFNLVCSYHAAKIKEKGEGKEEAGGREIFYSFSSRLPPPFLPFQTYLPDNKISFIQGKPHYLCIMNEPTHAHFVLADAQYCHVLNDRLIIGNRELPQKMPEPTGKPDYTTLGLQISGILILAFFLIMTLITHYYVVTFTVSLLLLTLLISFIRTAGFTSTKAIMTADIVGVDYKKRFLGYDFFIVHYAGPKGKECKRRLPIYDSEKCLEQALTVMKEAKLLK
ncbi:MAG: hypothetical protein ABIQ40_06700 [Bacteroidia bacterium]